MSRRKLGEIPDDYHENDALPEKDTPPRETEEGLDNLKSEAVKIIKNRLGVIPRLTL